MIFHPFTLEDQAKLAPYYAAITYPSCEYAFANNFLWSQHYHNTWTELEGCLVLCYPGEGPAYTVLPGSGNPKAAICALRREAKSQGVSLQLEVSRRQWELLQTWFPGEVSYTLQPDFGEYLYETAALQQMSGKKLHSKKNLINRFDREHTWSYESITPENKEECLAMLSLWKQRRSQEQLAEATALDELEIDRIALTLLEPLGLAGGLLRAEGQVVGISLGEPVGGDTFVIHVEKAFSWIPGAYPMLVREFARHAGAGYRYLNREEDLGVEGLRRSKLSYRPCAILEKGVAVFTE